MKKYSFLILGKNKLEKIKIKIVLTISLFIMLSIHSCSFAMLKLFTKSRLKSFTTELLAPNIRLDKATFSKKIKNFSKTSDFIGVTLHDKHDTFELYDTKTKSKKAKKPIFSAKNVAKYALCEKFLALRYYDKHDTFELYSTKTESKKAKKPIFSVKNVAEYSLHEKFLALNYNDKSLEVYNLKKINLKKPVFPKQNNVCAVSFTRNREKIFFIKNHMDSHRHAKYITKYITLYIYNLIKNTWELRDIWLHESFRAPRSWPNCINPYLYKKCMNACLSKDENIIIVTMDPFTYGSLLHPNPKGGRPPIAFYHPKSPGRPLAKKIHTYKEIPDNKIVIICHDIDCPIQIYNTKTGNLKIISQFKQKITEKDVVEISDNGTVIAIKSADTCHIYKITGLTLQPIRTVRLTQKVNCYASISVTNYGTLIECYGPMSRPPFIIHFPKTKPLPVWKYKINYEKKIIAIQTDGTFQIYDLSTTVPTIICNMQLAGETISDFSISPNFKTVALEFHEAGKVKLYNTNDKKHKALKTFKHHWDNEHDFNIDNNIFRLKNHNRKTILLYNLKTGKEHLFENVTKNVTDKKTNDIDNRKNLHIISGERIHILKFPPSREEKKLQDKKVILQDEKDRTIFLQENIAQKTGSDPHLCSIKTLQLSNKKITALATLLIG